MNTLPTVRLPISQTGRRDAPTVGWVTSLIRYFAFGVDASLLLNGLSSSVKEGNDWEITVYHNVAIKPGIPLPKLN